MLLDLICLLILIFIIKLFGFGFYFYLNNKGGQKMTNFNFKDLEKELEQAEKELEQAKEIIKTFCGLCDVFNSSNGSFDNLIAKAEAFINKE